MGWRQKSILHAKTMIIDNEAFIGSFNLNHRSVLHDLEVEVVLNDSASLYNMLSQWRQDLKDAKPAQEKDFTSSSWLISSRGGQMRCYGPAPWLQS
jgi:cardiolipin synthase